MSPDQDFFNLKAAKNESLGPVLDITVDSTSGFYNADTNFLGTSAMQSPLMETVQEVEAEQRELASLENRLNEISSS